MQMSVGSKLVATVLGALVVIAGLLLLFLPLSTSVNNNAIRCGSAAVASRHDLLESTLSTSLSAIDRGAQIAPIGQAEADCASARHTRAAIGWVLLGVGVVVAGGVQVATRRRAALL